MAVESEMIVQTNILLTPSISFIDCLLVQCILSVCSRNAGIGKKKFAYSPEMIFLIAHRIVLRAISNFVIDDLQASRAIAPNSGPQAS